jgi:hypothetical protein
LGLALFTEAMRRITARGGHPVLIRMNDEVRHVFETLGSSGSLSQPMKKWIRQ